jgi:hypothetical protein
MVLCFTILVISNIKKSYAHSLLSDQIESTCLAVTQSKINSPHLIDLIFFLLLSAAKLSMESIGTVLPRDHFFADNFR